MKRDNGFTLTEVLVALAVLAFALVPLMGVMWSGVRKTDISNSYSNASNVGASILEFLLNDSVRFQDLDFSNPLANPLRDADASRESAGFTTATIGRNDFLGTYCAQTAPPATCQSVMSKARYFKIGRENYYTDLYIGAYHVGVPGSAGRTTWVSHGYLENPSIDYEQVPNKPHHLYDTLSLSSAVTYLRSDSFANIPVEGNGDYTAYSPYYQPQWAIDPGLHDRRTKSDEEISIPLDNANIPFNYLGANASNAQYANFAKIQLFIRWGWQNAFETAGTDWTQAAQRSRVDERGGAKMIQLVTFKGRFQ